jgi:hypothetical protein
MKTKKNKKKEKSWSNMEYLIGWISQMVWASLLHVITILKSSHMYRTSTGFSHLALAWVYHRDIGKVYSGNAT